MKEQKDLKTLLTFATGWWRVQGRKKNPVLLRKQNINDEGRQKRRMHTSRSAMCSIQTVKYLHIPHTFREHQGPHLWFLKKAEVIKQTMSTKLLYSFHIAINTNWIHFPSTPHTRTQTHTSPTPHLWPWVDSLRIHFVSFKKWILYFKKRMSNSMK